MKPERFPGGHRPIPRAMAYPADYALATATQQLVRQYGVHGAINRLIELAEALDAGEDPVSRVLKRRLVDSPVDALPKP